MTAHRTSHATAPGDTAESASVAGRPTVLVACDLDRTLIYSAAALHLPGPGTETAEDPRHRLDAAPGIAPDAEPDAEPGSVDAARPVETVADPRLRCVEQYRSRPQSYLTTAAADLLAALTERAVFVPATTRTVDQYHRVRLPGRPSRYAVCANGGRLLVDGVSDPDWEVRVSRALAAECAPLGEVLAHLDRTAGRAGWPHRVRTAENLFCYVVAEPGDVPPGWTAELADWAEPRGWTVSAQGRKTYLVPRPLTKDAAVTEVARRIGAAEILAAGDALLDAGLLAAADRGWRPGHGELAAAGWTAPRVTALTSRGVRCAEEILRGMLHHLGPVSPAAGQPGQDLPRDAPPPSSGLSSC